MENSISSIAAITVVGTLLILCFRRWAYFELLSWTIIIALSLEPGRIKSYASDGGVGVFLLFKEFFSYSFCWLMSLHRSVIGFSLNHAPGNSTLKRCYSHPCWNWIAYFGIIGQGCALLCLDCAGGLWFSLPCSLALTVFAPIPIKRGIVSVQVEKVGKGWRARPFELELGNWWVLLFSVWYLPFLMFHIPGAVPWAIFHAAVPAIACFVLGSSDHWGYFRIHTLGLTMFISMCIYSLGVHESLLPKFFEVSGSALYGGMQLDSLYFLFFYSYLLVPFLAFQFFKRFRSRSGECTKIVSGLPT